MAVGNIIILLACFLLLAVYSFVFPAPSIIVLLCCKHKYLIRKWKNRDKKKNPPEMNLIYLFSWFDNNKENKRNPLNIYGGNFRISLECVTI